MKELNIEPYECIILEDNDHGIQAALAIKGNLMKIGIPDDVTYQNIMSSIKDIEEK